MALSEGAPDRAGSWERLCLCSALTVREYPAEEGTPPQSTAGAETSRGELTTTEVRADAAEEDETAPLIPRLVVAEEEAARAMRERDSVTRERDALLEKVEKQQAAMAALQARVSLVEEEKAKLEAQLATPEQNAAEPDKQPPAAAPPAAPPPPAPGPPPVPTAALAAAPALDVARISAVQLQKPPALASAQNPSAVRLASTFVQECDQNDRDLLALPAL